MPSSSPSRRAFLAAASGSLGAALAGCFDSYRGTTSGHETVVDGHYSSTDEYEVRFVRNDADELFVFQDEDTAREVAETPEDEPLPIGAAPVLFVRDDAEAEDLWIETREDDLRPFVEETDFETETIAIDQRPIGDCYYRDVRGVEAQDDNFVVHYCRRLKAPTSPCEADEEVMEAVVLRVSRSYEERPSSRGSTESMTCREHSSASESNATGDGGDQE